MELASAMKRYSGFLVTDHAEKYLSKESSISQRDVRAIQANKHIYTIYWLPGNFLLFFSFLTISLGQRSMLSGGYLGP